MRRCVQLSEDKKMEDALESRDMNDSAIVMSSLRALMTTALPFLFIVPLHVRAADNDPSYHACVPLHRGARAAVPHPQMGYDAVRGGQHKASQRWPAFAHMCCMLSHII